MPPTTHTHKSVCGCALSPVWLFAAPWTVPMKLLFPWNFPGKNTRVGGHFLLQGDLPNPGIKPTSLVSPALAGRFFTTGTTWEAHTEFWVPGFLLRKQRQSQALCDLFAIKTTDSLMSVPMSCLLPCCDGVKSLLLLGANPPKFSGILCSWFSLLAPLHSLRLIDYYPWALSPFMPPTEAISQMIWVS